MSGLPSVVGGHGALHQVGLPDGVSEFLPPAAAAAGANNKRKRRPAGTPDPDAEVVALSPKTLMESDRYVCEICNQGFQRDQNLQMHRRRHKVPWKLLKKPSTLGTNKRVYICPERSCLHHDPTHALGDLVGIKKHYRRKHCTEKQWKCVKCSKRYAVQSDFKAHLKTCGTRGHCCDCGRVFSRVESFIEHQDSCGAAKHKQSGGAASERKPPVLLHDVTDRISHDSRSQSSDSTQVMSFPQSGMSDTAGARSGNSSQARPTADVDDASRRILLESQQSAYNAAMPAWLKELRGNKLALLQPPKQHSPPVNSEFPGIRRVIVDHPGSFDSAGPELSFPETTTSTLPEDANSPSLSLSIGRTGSVDRCTSVEMPCLRLSIGPSSAEMAASSCSSPYADTKPAARFGSRESLPIATTSERSYHQSPVASGLRSSRVQDCKFSHPAATPFSGNDLALWISEPGARNQTMDGSTGTQDQQAASLRDFLAQAWRPGAMLGCGSR